MYLCKTCKRYAHGGCLWRARNCRKMGKRGWHKHTFNSGSICDYQQLPNWGLLWDKWSCPKTVPTKWKESKKRPSRTQASCNMVNCTGCIATTSSLLFFSPRILSVEDVESFICHFGSFGCNSIRGHQTVVRIRDPKIECLWPWALSIVWKSGVLISRHPEDVPSKIYVLCELLVRSCGLSWKI